MQPDPCLSKDIQRIKAAQKFALRVDWNSPYDDLLMESGLCELSVCTGGIQLSDDGKFSLTCRLSICTYRNPTLKLLNTELRPY